MNENNYLEGILLKDWDKKKVEDCRFQSVSAASDYVSKFLIYGFLFYLI